MWNCSKKGARKEVVEVRGGEVKNHLGVKHILQEGLPVNGSNATDRMEGGRTRFKFCRSAMIN